MHRQHTEERNPLQFTNYSYYGNRNTELLLRNEQTL